MIRRRLPGQSILNLPASEFNQIASTTAQVETWRRSPSDRSPIDFRESREIVMVKNGSGAAIDVGGVLAIESPLFTPADAPIGFKLRPALLGTTPSGTTAGRIAISIQPIPSGAIGRCVVAGIAATQVEIVEESSLSAGEISGATNRLQLRQGGTVRVLWRESGSTGTKLAYVLLGGGSGTGGQERFVVDEASTGLVAGSDPPRWYYRLQPASLVAATGVRAAIVGAPIVRAWNLWEDPTDYAHGQPLTLANGATLTPSMVKGPVLATWTGLFDEGVKVYEFDAACPTEPECGS